MLPKLHQKGSFRNSASELVKQFMGPSTLPRGTSELPYCRLCLNSCQVFTHPTNILESPALSALVIACFFPSPALLRAAETLAVTTGPFFFLFSFFFKLGVLKVKVRVQQRWQAPPAPSVGGHPGGRQEL